MALRLAHYMEWSKADTYEALPPKYRQYFESQKYADIVMPLINFDRFNGHSIRGLSNKYGISKSEIFRRLNKSSSLQ